MDIPIGAKVTVEITTQPRTESARKTLVRLCRKDPQVAKMDRQRKAKRPSWEEWRRGGTMWHHQMKSQSAVEIKRGASYKLHATLDVLRDLESVKRWVKVTPVK